MQHHLDWGVLKMLAANFKCKSILSTKLVFSDNLIAMAWDNADISETLLGT